MFDTQNGDVFFVCREFFHHFLFFLLRIMWNHKIPLTAVFREWEGEIEWVREQEPTQSGNTGPWLANNQSRDLDNDFWLVV